MPKLRLKSGYRYSERLYHARISPSHNWHLSVCELKDVEHLSNKSIHLQANATQCALPCTSVLYQFHFYKVLWNRQVDSIQRQVAFLDIELCSWSLKHVIIDPNCRWNEYNKPGHCFQSVASTELNVQVV